MFAYELSGNGLSVGNYSVGKNAGDPNATLSSSVKGYKPEETSLVISCDSVFSQHGFSSIRPGTGYILDKSVGVVFAAEHLSGSGNTKTRSLFYFNAPRYTWTEVSVSFV